MSRRSVSLVLTLATLLASPHAHAQQLPSKALILGVPFISWHDAAALNYQDKDVLNPSMPAVVGMVLRYWGQDLRLLQDWSKALPSTGPGWARVERGDSGSLDRLKRFVARGIPVVVSTAITPFAHTPSPNAAALAVLVREGMHLPTREDSHLRFEFESDAQARRFQALIFQNGPGGGILGRMQPLDTLRRWNESPPLSVWETLLLSMRVVIGYDDERRVVTMHDPSFGPAWELSYDDFLTAWTATGASYITAIPHDSTTRAAATAYPERTVAQPAAEHLVFGVALQAVGRLDDAQRRLRAGLALPGLSRGYEHLLHLELAEVLWQSEDFEGARVSIDQATRLLPEHWRVWAVWAGIWPGMRVHGGAPAAAKERETFAADADQKAWARCDDRNAQEVVARVLPHDFVIFGCTELMELPRPAPR